MHTPVAAKHLFAGGAVALVVLMGTTARPKAVQAGADDWGEPVGGVQLRLAVGVPAKDGPSPTEVALPPLELRVRNRSGRPVAFLAESLSIWPTIEIDNVWYSSVSAGSCCSSPRTIAPGEQSAAFRLSFQSDLYETTGGKSRMLNLRPGKHAVRVKVSIDDREFHGRGPSFPAIVLLSNMITVDALAIPEGVEKRALVDAVSAGNEKAWQAVPKLVARYPDAALGAVEVGLRATASEFIRGILISWLGDVQGPDVTAFLQSKLGADTDYPSRAAAATILFRRGDPHGILAALQAWRDIHSTLLAPTDQLGTNDAFGGIISILAESGDADAIDALGRDSRQDPIDVRLAVVKVFLPRKQGGTSGPVVILNGELPTLPGGPAGVAIERLLGVALDDKEPRVGLKGNYGDVTFTDPRVCDMAALTMSERWPQIYAFRWSDSVRERDAQIEKIRTIWRGRDAGK